VTQRLNSQIKPDIYNFVVRNFICAQEYNYSQKINENHLNGVDKGNRQSWERTVNKKRGLRLLTWLFIEKFPGKCRN
jgi:hypothetical protein